jgi:hypothetical protein
MFIFLSLTQLAPLYLGWELVTGKRPGQDEEKEVVEGLPQSPPEKVIEEPAQPIPVVKESPELVGETVIEDKVEAPSETVVDAPGEASQETIVDASPLLPDEESSEAQA